MKTAQPTTITIDSVVYPLRFGYACLRALSRMWQLDDLQEVFTRLATISDLTAGQLKPATIDTLADLTLASIVAAGNDVTFDSAHVADVLLQDIDQVAAIVQEFAASMPQANDSKKKNPQPQLRKTSKSKRI